jgi:hypothetical protein
MYGTPLLAAHAGPAATCSHEDSITQASRCVPRLPDAEDRHALLARALAQQRPALLRIDLSGGGVRGCRVAMPSTPAGTGTLLGRFRDGYRKQLQTNPMLTQTATSTLLW